MPTLADVIRQHGPSYRARFGDRTLPSHARAMSDIVACRTAAMGGHIEHCCACGQRHLVYHSCHNRACPRCGADRATSWVARQRELLLPIPYFHVVFTIPAEVRALVRSHQRELLPILFRAAFDSLQALCADPTYLGGRIGALAVLHTWTRTLQWHPHVHLLVPGGAVAPDDTWIPCRRNRKTREPFLVPVHALSRKFWGRFMALARRALPHAVFPNMRKSKRWVVHAKSVLTGGEHVIEYLGRYIHRTALSNRALLGCDEQRVTFRYRDSRDGRRKILRLPGHEFLRRYLQHALPWGIHRVRSFGLLHPSQRTTLRRLQTLFRRPPISTEPAPHARQTTPRRCVSCGGSEWQRGPRLNALDCFAIEKELVTHSAVAVARGPPSSTEVAS
jgi:hypothetical protein